MKKKILLVVVFAALAFTLIKARDYYQDRYVLDNTYYLKVPVDINEELDDLYDKDHKVVATGKIYDLIGVDESGNKKALQFDIVCEDKSGLLKPNEYVKIQVSKTLVLSNKVVSENQVPKNVLKYIN